MFNMLRKLVISAPRVSKPPSSTESDHLFHQKIQIGCPSLIDHHLHNQALPREWRAWALKPCSQLGGNGTCLLYILRDALVTRLAHQNWAETQVSPRQMPPSPPIHTEARASLRSALHTVRVRNDPIPLQQAQGSHFWDLGVLKSSAWAYTQNPGRRRQGF